MSVKFRASASLADQDSGDTAPVGCAEAWHAARGQDPTTAPEVGVIRSSPARRTVAGCSVHCYR